MPLDTSTRSAQDYSDWIGRMETRDDEIGLTLARRAAVLSDLDPQAFGRGVALPPHWYSMFFTPNAPAARIGHDGHPMKGDFLPPIALPRRMFVGREVTFLQPLRIGAEAIKTSRITAITPKTGRSGPLMFVQVTHTISADGQDAIVEKQNVVYRQAASAGTAAAAADAGADAGLPSAAWREQRLIDPVLLFRYSALTWNSHRIHYDADYARDKEGYRGCVMNGALTLHLLIDAALRRMEGRPLRRLEARLSSPLFLGDTMTLEGAAPARDGATGQDTVQAWVLDPQGRVSAQVTLGFGPGEGAAHGAR
ncbi:MaoC family dehydratase N-terminal domain-containing protein [Bordetella sp. LUAb4]|uniref:FAS1-like dehydratase domain-containing protein n=1 Tax=Bordetella sp. LUAb4 TaxID=2843195 RepID=UPI001E4F13CB|nr:MaoC family dehydratase N-terminal domain-containing protein [Bordetella sp. LUAb4]